MQDNSLPDFCATRCGGLRGEEEGRRVAGGCRGSRGEGWRVGVVGAGGGRGGWVGEGLEEIAKHYETCN